jgi:hypothetical protein
MTDLVQGVPVSKHPLYTVWTGMKKRCSDDKSDSYKRYGGRGISVCAEWLASSLSFCEWAMANGWASGLQLDRRDNDGNYTPENCRFVSRKVNGRNKGNTRRVSDGAALCDVAEAKGLAFSTVYWRLRNGWSEAEALSVPSGAERSERPLLARPRRRLKDGRNASDVAKQNGICRAVWDSRVRYGWSVDDAVTLPVGSKRPDESQYILPL